jgi:hypothetical protein
VAAGSFERAVLADGFRFARTKKVFNTTVDNTVEKGDCIFVSDSGREGSTLCTGAGAGTFVLQPLVRCDGREIF